MEDVRATLRTGRSCVIEAVPGAGKSYVIAQVCSEASLPSRALVFAYNTQLAHELATKLPAETPCVTFHAFCSKHVAMARNDDQMAEAITSLRRGDVRATALPDVDLVCIDEAQDVRPLYLDLLHACGILTSPGQRGRPLQLIVCGDQNQLIYDFDPDHPASLDLLLGTEAMFPQFEWTRLRFSTTNRVPPAPTALARLVFGISDLVSSKSAADYPPVEFRAARSAFRAYDALQDVFRSEPSVLLLVDRKVNNHPLRALLNQCDANGQRIFVHGINPAGVLSPRGLTCGSYWSAKGLEAPCVVAWLSSSAAANPLYVALTRASRRLIVLLDSKEPHAAVCAAACALRNDPATARFVSVTSKEAEAALAKGATMDAAASLCGRNWGPHSLMGDVAKMKLKRDRVRPVVEKTAKAAAPIAVMSDDDELLTGDDPLLIRIAVRAAVMYAELSFHGVICGIEDMTCPYRAARDNVLELVQSGLRARIVPSFMRDDDLLPPDLARITFDSYGRAKTQVHFGPDLVVLALAHLSWGEYHYLMRSHLDRAEDICARVRDSADWLVQTLGCFADADGERLAFDTVLASGSRYGRVHAASARCAYFCCGDAGADEEAEATALAAIHPRRTCVLIDVASQCTRQIVVDDPDSLFAA